VSPYTLADSGTRCRIIPDRRHRQRSLPANERQNGFALRIGLRSIRAIPTLSKVLFLGQDASRPMSGNGRLSESDRPP